jgi:hypothetical protein
VANLRIPGPLGHDVHLANSYGRLWCGLGCRRGHTPGPIRVADAPTDKSKKTARNLVAPPVTGAIQGSSSSLTKVDTIILHLYRDPKEQDKTKGFSQQEFIRWFKAPADPDIPNVGKWSDERIDLEFYTDKKSGVKDFEKSLQRKGAIVVYMGHSTLDKFHGFHSLGLTPQGKKQPEIPNATLRTLLSKSPASLVIIASCDSKTAVGKLSAGPPIIVTNSGADEETDHLALVDAVAVFLFLLIGWEMDGRGQPNDPHKGGHATIDEALSAANVVLKASQIDDQFELINGNGSIKLFP